MQYYSFKEQLQDFIVFSISDIRKIEPKFYHQRLKEWQNKGYIKKLRRGYYLFADAALNEETLFLIANKLYAPSYVSLEMALSYYNLIPEGVYSVTSVTSKKTVKFKTPIGEFAYRSIKPELLFGYSLQRLGQRSCQLAEMEKAVLDYLYLNPKSANPEDLQEWRFEGREFLSRANLPKFNNYVKAFSSPALEKRARKFLNFIKQQP